MYGFDRDVEADSCFGVVLADCFEDMVAWIWDSAVHVEIFSSLQSRGKFDPYLFSQGLAAG